MLVLYSLFAAIICTALPRKPAIFRKDPIDSTFIFLISSIHFADRIHTKNFIMYGKAAASPVYNKNNSSIQYIITDVRTIPKLNSSGHSQVLCTFKFLCMLSGHVHLRPSVSESYHLTRLPSACFNTGHGHFRVLNEP